MPAPRGLSLTPAPMPSHRPHPLHVLLVLAVIAVGVAGSLWAPGSAAVVIAAAVGTATVLGVLLDGAAVEGRPARPPPPDPEAITVDLGRRS